MNTAYWETLKFFAGLVSLYVSVTVSLIAVQWAYFAFLRGFYLTVAMTRIAAQFLCLGLVWPIELAIDRAEKMLARAAEHRAQWIIWRAEFRGAMSWQEFRQQMSGTAPAKRGPLEEALAVLGLAEGFSRSDLDSRFRRLIQNVHPDKGGSEHLAQLVTGARKTILEQKGWKK